ncbi:MAG: hypothetical protein C0392_05825 [Syntrophus sp. (in: bacteria)]|nr:hypothetical protein [Syntrophus sp. (in: bacteria)]
MVFSSPDKEIVHYERRLKRWDATLVISIILAGCFYINGLDHLIKTGHGWTVLLCHIFIGIAIWAYVTDKDYRATIRNIKRRNNINDDD